MIAIFHGDDAASHEAFQSWRRRHVDGFHMTEGPKARFTVHYTQDKRENLQGRGCIHQGGSGNRYLQDKNGCYTTARKVCSESYGELLSWATTNSFTTKSCKHCDTRRFPFSSEGNESELVSRAGSTRRNLREPHRTVKAGPSRPSRIAPATRAKELKLRFDEDLEYLRETSTVVMRRKHNEMTNVLRGACARLGIHAREGDHPDCLFDALLLNYRGDDRALLVEVKTSCSPPFCRMAVGQLLDYQRRLPNRKDVDLAALFPSKPEKHMIEYLKFAGVKPLWINRRKTIRGLG